jgi:hypothetical protein
MVDEHYYNTPGWFIYNQDFYDKYDRNRSKVYLGEYAAHLPGRPNNIETALSEALYLTSIERNGDLVQMSSYAPLLAKEGHTNWNPDLIYFNNKEVKPTIWAIVGSVLLYLLLSIRLVSNINYTPEYTTLGGKCTFDFIALKENHNTSNIINNNIFSIPPFSRFFN